MIQTILVDDEPLALKNLSLMLEPHKSSIEIVAKASTIEEAVEVICEHKPDLVFLDIDLDGERSFDILERFPNATFEIIFVTAFNDFGIEALKKGALDYILKPIQKVELFNAIQKVENRISEKEKSSGSKERFVNHKISLPTNRGLLFVEASQIIYCESEGRYTRFFILKDNKQSKILVSKNLGAYETILPKEHFIRVHHQHIINIEHIDEYKRGSGGILVMCNGKELAVSKRRKDTLLKKLGID